MNDSETTTHPRISLDVSKVLKLGGSSLKLSKPPGPMVGKPDAITAMVSKPAGSA